MLANCGVAADEEMRDIDRLEDELSPLPENIARIRGLISTLELCHHKAERWVTNIIEAIGEGGTSKGLGTRTAGELHPAERDWMNACMDSTLLELLGNTTAPQRWLVASLEKTIRLQLSL